MSGVSYTTAGKPQTPPAPPGLHAVEPPIDVSGDPRFGVLPDGSSVRFDAYMPICCQHGLPPQKSQVTDSTAVRFVTTGASGEALPMCTLAQSFVLAALPKPYQMRGLKTPFSITPSSRMPKQRFGEQSLTAVTVVLAKLESLIL